MAIFRTILHYYGSNSQFLLMTLSFWSILSWFSNYIICFEGFKQNCVFHYQNLIFESIGHLLRTELESKVEWVESISYDSLGVSRVEKFRLTLNTTVKRHNKNLPNLTWQMDGFLPLGGIFGFLRLNEFCRLAFILDFIVKNIFLN